MSEGSKPDLNHVWPQIDWIGGKNQIMAAKAVGVKKFVWVSVYHFSIEIATILTFRHT